ncbi:MAG: acyl-CoA reductase [Chitinophagaceae bacterium]|nr:MAG: acyl-CoA reductase [Chitinophagaceae bacterium]
MNLSQRIELLSKLKSYISENTEEWQEQKHIAFIKNAWFTPEFIDLAVQNIVDYFLDESKLSNWVQQYQVPDQNPQPKKIGIVMAGNIPLVGFHDFLCVFITGNIAVLKLSSKDEVLIKHLISKLIEWNTSINELVILKDIINNCDAYIATGSNNSAGYFEYYFKKFPHIIRKNRTSIAVLNGNETDEDLAALANDVFQFFGLGCRNITKLLVPEDFNFERMLDIFKKFDYLADHHKLKNNYDYNLSLLILNNKKYMSTASIILSDNASYFSPISVLHYEVYKDKSELDALTCDHNSIQCIAGADYTPFGQVQKPKLTDYADGVDTMLFLTKL